MEGLSLYNCTAIIDKCKKAGKSYQLIPRYVLDSSRFPGFVFGIQIRSEE
jgi:hypothetical protein